MFLYSIISDMLFPQIFCIAMIAPHHVFCVIKDGPSIVKKIKGTYSFKVKNSSGKQGVWFVDVKSGNGTVTFGDSSRLTLCYLLLFPISLLHVDMAYKH